MLSAVKKKRPAQLSAVPRSMHDDNNASMQTQQFVNMPREKGIGILVDFGKIPKENLGLAKVLRARTLVRLILVGKSRVVFVELI